jgi:hypothetical protein
VISDVAPAWVLRHRAQVVINAVERGKNPANVELVPSDVETFRF